jgi:hypothetical protein
MAAGINGLPWLTFLTLTIGPNMLFQALAQPKPLLNANNRRRMPYASGGRSNLALIKRCSNFAGGQAGEFVEHRPQSGPVNGSRECSRTVTGRHACVWRYVGITASD